MTEHVRAEADALVIRGVDDVGVAGVVVGAATDVGRLRTINEDGYLAISPAFVVVDGMGGHAAGRMATQVALDSLYSLAGTTVTDVETVVRAVKAAQEAIVAIPSHAAYLPGATIAGVVLAWMEDDQGVTRPTWIIFNIGDARVYLLRDDMLSQVTRDHSRSRSWSRPARSPLSRPGTTPAATWSPAPWEGALPTPPSPISTASRWLPETGCSSAPTA